MTFSIKSEPHQPGSPAVGANQPRKPLSNLIVLMIKSHVPNMGYCYKPSIVSRNKRRQAVECLVKRSSPTQEAPPLTFR